MKAWLIALSITTAGIVSGPTFAQEKAAVPIYDSTEIALDRYTVIKRLGVEDWRSAFFVRSYRDATTATEALLAEAAQLGADGLVNLQCLGQSDRPNGAGYYCYANAIRLKQ